MSTRARDRLRCIVTGRYPWNHTVGLVHDLLGSRQDCPRRVAGIGPWSIEANGLDRWTRGRWGTRASRAIVRFFHADPKSRAYRLLAVIQRHPPYIGGTTWRWPWAPRDCSFCGGGHPDDLLRLIREGWEVERAKSYKAYLYPPGYRAEMERLRRLTWSYGAPISAAWSPVPPVKLYTAHFSDPQLAALNVLVTRAPGP